MRYRTLKSIASDLCAIHLGDTAGNKMGLAVRALRNTLDELSISVLPNVVTKMMEIGSDHTVLMPGDCMQVVKVGVLLDNGQVRFLGRSDEIRRNVESECCTCDEEAATQSAVIACSACTFHNYGGNNLGEAYGYRLPEFPNGYYRYNGKENRIEFGTGYDVYEDNRVLVEYIGSFAADDYNTIPSELANAVMYHSAHALNISASPGRSSYYMNEFLRSYRQYKESTQNNLYDIDDLVAALRGQSMSAPKF